MFDAEFLSEFHKRYDRYLAKKEKKATPAKPAVKAPGKPSAPAAKAPGKRRA